MLGTKVEFAYEPSGKAFWIRAPTSENLGHPYAENWLTEPLRIMLGSLIYPFMGARNFGDGTAHVWLRPSPRSQQHSAFGLMQPFGMTAEHDVAFWHLYAKILSVIALARDESGDPNFQSHKITRLYEELAQAQHGSRWVKLLTLASTAEALTKELWKDQDRKSDYAEADLTSMKQHLKDWTGNENLRNALKSALCRLKKVTPTGFMRRLVKHGVLNLSEVKTWGELRNEVMHGNLVDPWPTEKGDKHLLELISLVHKLTHALIEKKSSIHVPL